MFKFIRAAHFVVSQIAILLCLASPVRAADGYANVNGTTTGGSGAPVVVTSLSQLTAAISDDVSRVVHVQGTINLGSSSIRFGSNKTIVGLGSNSGFIGNLKGVDENNVILQNLNFSNPNSVGDGDGLTLDGCTHVWVDHCAFVQCGDGSLDITHGSDYITVSWSKFSYTSNTGHNFVNLIGHSDDNSAEDSGRLKVTFHHNWWSTLCVERMPRVRFGRIHTYNNFFNSPGNNHCIRASIQSHVLAENNYFESISTPFQKYASSAATGSQVGLIRSAGNSFVNCSGVQNFNDSVFVPPYSYSLESPATARSAIISGAGPTLVIGGGAIPNGTYRIVARHSGKALDASGGGTANGTQIHQWTYGGGNNQRWTVTDRGAGQYSIIGVQSGKAVEVSAWGTANGTKVQLWDWLNGSNQKHTFAAASGGYYRITPTHATGSCLDVAGVSTADGALVHLWQWLNGSNQQWAFQAP